VYFKKPLDFPVCATIKGYPGLEFKTKFIMAAGSFIEKTDKGEPVNKPYVPICGAPGTIIPAPTILLARIKYEGSKRILTADVVPDNPSDVYKFIEYCQSTEPAVEGQGGDNKTFSAASFGRSLGLSEGTVFEAMKLHFNPRCSPPWEDDELETKVSHAFQYAAEPAGVNSIQNHFDKVPVVEHVKISYQFTAQGGLKNSMANLVQFMKYPTISESKEGVKRTYNIPPIGHNLRYDMFSQRVLWAAPAPWYKSAQEWEDEDAIQFKHILSKEVLLEFAIERIHEAAVYCAREKAFHPVRDYLQSVKWDGIKRVDSFLSTYCGANDDVYTRFCGRKTLVAAVARVFSPGCKFDHVLVTEGRQGLGKSYMWEILASPWFTDAPLNLADKGAVEVIQGRWVIELAEMEALTKYESQTIKRFLTSTEDRCRMAYGRSAKSFPRQCIFVGSINPEQTGWLKDKTGNRRYWPVPVFDIDIPALKRDKDQLWAESLRMYESGEKLHVETEDMRILMADQVNSRLAEDPWLMVVEEYITRHLEELRNPEGDIETEPVDLYIKAIGGGAAAFGHREATRMGTILKTLNFERRRVVGKFGSKYVRHIGGTEL
jgi:hypothetical protein